MKGPGGRWAETEKLLVNALVMAVQALLLWPCWNCAVPKLTGLPSLAYLETLALVMIVSFVKSR